MSDDYDEFLRKMAEEPQDVPAGVTGDHDDDHDKFLSEMTKEQRDAEGGVMSDHDEFLREMPEEQRERIEKRLRDLGAWQHDITAPEVLVTLYEPSWDALRLAEEQREPIRRYLRDIAARHDLEAIHRFGAGMEGVALDMDFAADMVIDTEREIRKLTGEEP